MSNIELYVQQKRRLRDDIPSSVFELAKTAVSKKAAQKIIRTFLSESNLPKGVSNGCIG